MLQSKLFSSLQSVRCKVLKHVQYDSDLAKLHLYYGVRLAINMSWRRFTKGYYSAQIATPNAILRVTTWFGWETELLKAKSHAKQLMHDSGPSLTEWIVRLQSVFSYFRFPLGSRTWQWQCLWCNWECSLHPHCKRWAHDGKFLSSSRPSPWWSLWHVKATAQVRERWKVKWFWGHETIETCGFNMFQPPNPRIRKTNNHQCPSPLKVIYKTNQKTTSKPPCGSCYISTAHHFVWKPLLPKPKWPYSATVALGYFAKATQVLPKVAQVRCTFSARQVKSASSHGMMVLRFRVLKGFYDGLGPKKMFMDLE